MPEQGKTIAIKLAGTEVTERGLRVLKSSKARYYLSKWCKWYGVEWETLRQGQLLHLTLSPDGQWVREVKVANHSAPASTPATSPPPAGASLRETALRLAASVFTFPHADLKDVEEIAQAVVAAAGIFEAYLAGGSEEAAEEETLEES